MRTIGTANAPTPSNADDVREYYHRVLPFYDAELRERGDEGFWIWAASLPAGCRVLEVGAGTGRATAFLARAAGRVVAFDLSPEMVAVARRRLASQRHVSLLVADLRNARFAERFDLVAAVNDPCVHLTGDADRDRALATMAEHLAPGGRVILDAGWLSPERRRIAEAQGLVEDRQPARHLSVRETWRCSTGTRLCTSAFEYRLDGQLNAEASFPARLWSRAELTERCAAAGLVITRLWGDYDRRPWDRNTSPRLIAEMQARV